MTTRTRLRIADVDKLLEILAALGKKRGGSLGRLTPVERLRSIGSVFEKVVLADLHAALVAPKKR